MFKEKLLIQLIAKYPGVSKKFLGLWAEKLQSKVTEESQIEGVINELDNLPVPITDLATEFQKEGDDRVTAAKKEWIKTPPKPDKPPKTDPPPVDPPIDPPKDDMPAWFKPYADELESGRKEKAKLVLAEKLKGNQKLKDIPEKFWNKRKLPETDEEIEAFADETAADWAEVAPPADGALKPTTNGQQNKGGKQATKEELEQLFPK